MSKKLRDNGEGATYYEKSRDRYCAAVTWKDGARTRRKKRYFKTKSEANEWRIETVSAIKKGSPPLDDRQTVGAYLNAWLEAKRESVRPTTWETYREACELYLIPELGKIVLSRLTAADVEGLMRHMIADRKSPVRARYMRSVLRSALGRAVKKGTISKNAAALADVPYAPSKQASFMDTSEAQRLVDVALGKGRDKKGRQRKRDRLAALWIVAVTLGLRRGELAGLRWIDVDLDARTLAVRVQVQRLKHKRNKETKEIVEHRGLVESEPKSPTSRRALALAMSAVKALREHRALQRKERLKAGPLWKESGRVFTTEDGKTIDPRNILRRFHELLEDAGLPKRKMHETRHTAASLLLAGGVAGKVVQILLGHSDIRLTLNTYSHVTPALHREAAATMDAMLKTR